MIFKCILLISCIIWTITETKVVVSFGEWDYLCENVEDYKKISHPNDCTKFFQCLDREALPGNCAEGQAFDKSTGFCLPESMVDCSHISSTPSDVTTGAPTAPTPGTSTEGPPTAPTAPTPGTSTNQPTPTAPTAPPSGTTTPTPTTQGTTQGTTRDPTNWDYLCIGVEDYKQISHPNDCKKFFSCLNGAAIPGNCAEGQAFDKNIALCLPESMVDCSHISSTPSGPTNPTTSDPTGGPTAPTAPQPTTSAPTQATTRDPNNWDYLCIGVENYKQISHPYDCKKFFQCLDGAAIPGNCADGQLFDKIIALCLPESMVDCSHISTNPPTTTTTGFPTAPTAPTTSEGPPTAPTAPTRPPKI